MSSTSASAPDLESVRSALLPGGYGRSSLDVGGRSPLVRRASGCWLEDHDGRRLIDVNNNMTVNLHGNAHPRIVDVVSQRMTEGLISLGIANADELELASTLVGRVPGAEQVRFTNTGVEAVMLALRLARASTGRERILILSPGYHGTADVVLPAMGERGTRGVPHGVVAATTTIPRNDVRALVEAFDRHGDEFAAVLLDLCANRAGLTALSSEFAATAAELAHRYGAQLIIDEVVTFRIAYAGLAREYGLRPDMTVLGKTIGGGFPIGAVVGSRRALAPLHSAGPALEHGGTFTANPISMAAGTVTLELFDRHAVQRLNDLGAQLEAGLHGELDGTGWEFRRSGSIFRLWPAGWTPQTRPAAQRSLFWAWYDQGVLGSGSGLSSLSTAMDEETVDRLVERLRSTARAVAP